MDLYKPVNKYWSHFFVNVWLSSHVAGLGNVFKLILLHISVYLCGVLSTKMWVFKIFSVYICQSLLNLKLHPAPVLLYFDLIWDLFLLLGWYRLGFHFNVLFVFFGRFERKIKDAFGNRTGLFDTWPVWSLRSAAASISADGSVSSSATLSWWHWGFLLHSFIQTYSGACAVVKGVWSKSPLGFSDARVARKLQWSCMTQYILRVVRRMHFLWNYEAWVTWQIWNIGPKSSAWVSHGMSSNNGCTAFCVLVIKEVSWGYSSTYTWWGTCWFSSAVWLCLYFSI